MRWRPFEKLVPLFLCDIVKQRPGPPAHGNVVDLDPIRTTQFNASHDARIALQLKPGLLNRSMIPSPHGVSLIGASRPLQGVHRATPLSTSKDAGPGPSVVGGVPDGVSLDAPRALVYKFIDAQERELAVNGVSMGTVPKLALNFALNGLTYGKARGWRLREEPARAAAAPCSLPTGSNGPCDPVAFNLAVTPMKHVQSLMLGLGELSRKSLQGKPSRSGALKFPFLGEHPQRVIGRSRRFKWGATHWLGDHP